MFCRTCGAENPDNALFCQKCGAPTEQEAGAPKNEFQNQAEPVETPVEPVAPTYNQQPGQAPYQQPQYNAQGQAPYQPPQPLPSNTGQIVWSIINIILCTVLGIIALVFSINAGNAATTEIAVKNLKTAKTLNLIGTIVGALIVVIYIIAFIIAASTGSYYGNRFY